jgi:hypothetical protein
MSHENQIVWTTLTLDFPDEAAARLERIAQEAGLSFKCYCVRVLLKHLQQDASTEERERWLGQWLATFRRNGCDDIAKL